MTLSRLSLCHVKCALYRPPQIPCVFSSKIRLAFTVTDCKFKWHATNRSQIRIFFQLKRASRKPFQIQCVFSSNTRLAFNVTINLFDSQPTAPTFLFFRRKRAPQESCHIPQVHFHCVFSGNYNVSWVHKSVWIHMWCCQPLPDVVSFSKGKRASQELPGSFNDQGEL